MTGVEQHLVLILLGGPTAIAVPFVVARHLVERHSKQYGRVFAAKGELQVANAEAARRAAVRDLLDKELTR